MTDELQISFCRKAFSSNVSLQNRLSMSVSNVAYMLDVNSRDGGKFSLGNQIVTSEMNFMRVLSKIK